VVEIYSSIVDPARLLRQVRATAEFERRQLQLLRTVEGESVRSLAAQLGVTQLGAKNAPATVLRKLLGLPSKGLPEDRSWSGLEVKTVPVTPDGWPHEHTSFPAFRHLEVADQEWEDSDLLARVSRILFIPLGRTDRRTPALDAVVGRSFFWSPSREELSGMRHEWEMFRDEIAAGRADRLPTARSTRYVHVRPKDVKARPSDPAPGGLTLTRKCFWLNRGFVATIIRRSADGTSCDTA
jgi:DNA mismatch repair protein MutH